MRLTRLERLRYTVHDKTNTRRITEVLGGGWSRLLMTAPVERDNYIYKMVTSEQPASGQ